MGNLKCWEEPMCSRYEAEILTSEKMRTEFAVCELVHRSTIANGRCKCAFSEEIDALIRRNESHRISQAYNPKKTSIALARITGGQVCSQVRKVAQPGMLYAYAPSKELKVKIKSMCPQYSNQPPWPHGGVWPTAPSCVMGLRPVMPEP